MTRRTVLQILVFLLLCIPLLSVVAFLVYVAIPETTFVVLHPVSALLFLIVGLYGASVLHGWQKIKGVFYWIIVFLFAIVGTWSVCAYIVETTPPFLMHNVAIAPGVGIVFLLLMFLMMLKGAHRFFYLTLIGVLVCFIAYLLFSNYVVSHFGLEIWHPIFSIWNAILSMCVIVMNALVEDEENRGSADILICIALSIVVLGVVVTHIGMQIYINRIQTRAAEVYVQEKYSVHKRIQRIFESYEEIAQIIAHKVSTYESITKDEWDQVVAAVPIQNYPSLSVLSYVPMVTEGEKQTFPIKYASSFVADIVSTPGFDISTDPVRSQTLSRSIETRSVVATPYMEDTGMFSLYVPSGEGIIALTLRQKTLIEEILRASSGMSRVMIIVNEEDGTGDITTLQLGGARWDVAFKPLENSYMPTTSSVRSIGYSSTVLLMLLLCGAYWFGKKQKFRRMRGTFNIRPIPMQPYVLLEELSKEYAVTLSKYKQRLAATIPKRLPSVYIDPTLVRVVLETLLYNARQMTPVRGTVGLTVRVESVKRVAQSIVIACTDTGSGLSDREQRRLLTSEHLHIHRNGTELEGLRTAVYMLKMIDCEIAVWSQEGVGTTATLTIPVAPNEAAKAL